MATSGSKRIAERYVKALFDVASGATLSAVEKDLNALGELLASNAELQQFIGNPLLSRAEQAQAMEAVLNRLKANKLTIQFVTMLARQKRLGALPDIVTLFSDWAEAARGEMKAEVVSAVPLSSKDTAAIADKLGKTYGKKINLTVTEDKSLLGGVIVKIGSIQLDSSLSGKIRRLKLALKAA